jgi:mannose-6-phosphate isomerase-like protein (cupin superfamily)
MEPILITIQPGGSTYPDNPHEGEEVGYVLEGTITIVIDKEKYHAKKGESFYIACDKPHYLENRTSHLAKAIWISSPPMF